MLRVFAAVSTNVGVKGSAVVRVVQRSAPASNSSPCSTTRSDASLSTSARTPPPEPPYPDQTRKLMAGPPAHDTDLAE